MVSRRSFLSTALGASVCALGAPVLTRSKSKYSTQALDLVERSTVIDMLGLLTLDYKKLGAWETDPKRFLASDFSA